MVKAFAALTEDTSSVLSTYVGLGSSQQRLTPPPQSWCHLLASTGVHMYWTDIYTDTETHTHK